MSEGKKAGKKKDPNSLPVTFLGGETPRTDFRFQIGI